MLVTSQSLTTVSSQSARGDEIILRRKTLWQRGLIAQTLSWGRWISSSDVVIEKLLLPVEPLTQALTVFPRCFREKKG